MRGRREAAQADDNLQALIGGEPQTLATEFDHKARADRIGHDAPLAAPLARVGERA